MHELPNNEKPHEQVHRIFSSVASRYDLMNDLMSLGQHHFWKKTLINMATVENDAHWCDVGAGSGDIAINALQAYAAQIKSLTLLDPNEQMLAQAKRKLINAGLLGDYRFIVAGAENIPVEDASFTHVSFSFGLRNVEQRVEAIEEIKRVLQPQGEFLLMEFHPPTPGLFSTLFKMYAGRLLPKVGQFITNDKEAYTYLYESIMSFPSPSALITSIEATGLKLAAQSSFSNGIVGLYKFVKPA